MEYCFRPEASPYPGLSRLAPLDRLPSDLALRGLKLGASATAMRYLAKRRGVPHLSLRHIPFRALDRFDFTLHEPMTAPKALGYPSIFDACTATGRPVGLPGRLAGPAGERPARPGRPGARRRRADLRLPAPGRHGRAPVRDHLAGLLAAGAVYRRAVRAARERIARRFGDVTTLVFSDHGMSQLTRQFGIPELTSHPAFPERFFVALDATMVRLWYLDDDERLRAGTARTRRGPVPRSLSQRRGPGRASPAVQRPALRRRHLPAAAGHGDLPELPLLHQAEGHARLRPGRPGPVGHLHRPGRYCGAACRIRSTSPRSPPGDGCPRPHGWYDPDRPTRLAAQLTRNPGPVVSG